MDNMEDKGKRQKSLIVKTWERCKSLGGGRRISNSMGTQPPPLHVLTRKTKSCPRMAYDPDEERHRPRKQRVAPEGCFSVYVGPQKERFVIKTEYANHPLFKPLLEEAESEYGYNSEGPLVLPCNVDVFYKVLLEMEGDHEIRQGCGFAKGHGSYRLLSPSFMIT